MQKLLITLSFILLFSCQDPSALLPDLSSKGSIELDQNQAYNFITPDDSIVIDLSKAKALEQVTLLLRNSLGEEVEKQVIKKDAKISNYNYKPSTILVDGIYNLVLIDESSIVFNKIGIIYSKNKLSIKSAQLQPIYAKTGGKFLLTIELTEAPVADFWERISLSGKEVSYQKLNSKKLSTILNVPQFEGTYEIKAEFFPSFATPGFTTISSSLFVSTNLIVSKGLVFSQKLRILPPRDLFQFLYLYEGEGNDWANYKIGQTEQSYEFASGEELGRKIKGQLNTGLSLNSKGFFDPQIVYLRLDNIEGFKPGAIIETDGNRFSCKLVDENNFVIIIKNGDTLLEIPFKLKVKMGSIFKLSFRVLQSSDNLIKGQIDINGEILNWKFDKFLAQENSTPYRSLFNIPGDGNVLIYEAQIPIGRGLSLTGNVYTISQSSTDQSFELINSYQMETISYEFLQLKGSKYHLEVYDIEDNLIAKLNIDNKNSSQKLLIEIDGKKLKYSQSTEVPRIFYADKLIYRVKPVIEVATLKSKIDYTIEKIN